MKEIPTTTEHQELRGDRPLGVFKSFFVAVEERGARPVLERSLGARMRQLQTKFCLESFLPVEGAYQHALGACGSSTRCFFMPRERKTLKYWR